MAQYDGSIRIDTLIDQKGFNRGARSLMQGMTRLGNSLNGLIGTLGLGLSLVGLVSLGKQAIKTASDIQEVQNVVDTAFGDMSYKMEQFADTAIKQFGISKLSAKQMGSTFAAMGRSMVGSMEDATDMAIALTGRAADMASFYNKSFEETSTALKSIYTGETETLKQYGVVMTEVNLQEYAAEKGIKKKISAMTQAEKVQLRYNYVMEQTNLAAGDFAKTSNSWANQTRILSEQFKELLSILGTGLITVLTPVIKFLNKVLSMLIAIAKQVGAILSKLFGISIPTVQTGKLAQDMSDAATGAGDLASGIEEAGKAANKALAPFDKLNVLSQDSGGSGGKSSGGLGGGFEFPEIEIEETDVTPIDDLGDAIDDILDKAKPLFDWFKKLKELFKEGFFDGLGESWKDRVADIIESAKNIAKTLKEIFTDPAVVEAAKTMVEKIVYALGQVVGSIASIGLTIAQNIVGGIDKYLEQNKEFLKEKLVSIFNITGDVAALIGDACASIAYIFEAFGSESGQQLTANVIGIFTNTILSLLEIGLKFGRDILNCITKPINDNKEELRKALEGLLGVLAEVSGTILDAINHTFEKINEIYDKYFKPFFDSVAQGLSDLLAKFLEFWNGYMQPILDSWAEKFDILWEEHLKPLVDNVLEVVGLIVEALTMFWENTLQPLLEWIIEVLAPTIADICDIIFGVIDTAITFIVDLINGIVEVVKGVINILLGIATGDWQRVWNGFADVVRGISDVIKGIINAMIGTVEGVANAVVAAANTMIRAINSINFTVPSWIPGVGGNSVGFHLSEISKVSIPRLADGAVIRGGDPFVAVLGDQRHGQTNIETPLPTMVKAFKQALAESGNTGGGTYTFVAQLDGRTLLEETVKQNDIYFERTGMSKFAY